MCEIHAEGHTLFARPFSRVKGVCQEEVGRRAQWPRVRSGACPLKCPPKHVKIPTSPCLPYVAGLSRRGALRANHVGGLSNELIWPEVSFSPPFSLRVGWAEGVGSTGGAGRRGEGQDGLEEGWYHICGTRLFMQ